MFMRHPVKTSIGFGLLLIAFLYAVDKWLQWSRSDTLGALQLIVAVLLVPIAIYGFLTTAAAFQKAQATPKLDLCWQIQPGEYKKTLTIIHNTAVGIMGNHGRVSLINDGEAIAVWYRVHLEFPDWPMRQGMARVLSDRWHGNPSDSSYWQVENASSSGGSVRFRSNGEIACYPGDPLLLGSLNLSTDSQARYPPESFADYTIQTEHSDPVKGRLHIVIMKVDDAP